MSKAWSVVLLLGVCSFPAHAQDASPPLTQAVERLAASVERLSGLMERDAAAQVEEKEARRVQVAIGILSLRLRKIERIEEEIRSHLREEEDLQDGVVTLKAEIEAIPDQFRSENGGLSEAGREVLADFERRLKSFEARQAWLAERRAVLEGELASENRRLAGLEDILDGWLERAAGGTR